MVKLTKTWARHQALELVADFLEGGDLYRIFGGEIMDNVADRKGEETLNAGCKSAAKSIRRLIPAGRSALEGETWARRFRH